MEDSFRVGSLTTDEYEDLFQPISINKSLTFYQGHTGGTPTWDLFRTTLFIAYFCLFAGGLLANLWVIYIISCVIRQPRTEAPRAFQIYILALCTCDFLVSIFLIFLLADFIKGEWTFRSRFLCRIYLCSESLNKFCAPALLAALSCFCYLNLKFEIGQGGGGGGGGGGLDRRRSSLSSNSIVKSGASAVSVVCVCLCFVFISMTPLYLYTDLYHLVLHNQTHVMLVLSTKCAFQPSDDVMTAFMVYGFIGGYLLPAIVFTFFYCAILLRVRRHHSNSISTRCCHDNTVPSYFWRLVRTTLGLVIFYLLCWTPYWAMNLYQYFVTGEKSESVVMLGYFVHMLPYINSTGHPILYALLNKALKNDYEKVRAGLKAARERRRSELAINNSIMRTRRMTNVSMRSQRSPSGTGSIITLLASRRNQCTGRVLLLRSRYSGSQNSYGAFSFSQGTIASDGSWTPTSVETVMSRGSL